MRSKGISAIVIVVAVLFAAIAGLVVYLATNQRAPRQPGEQSPAPQNTLLPTPQVTQSNNELNQTYTSESLGFTIRYPEHMDFNIDTTQTGTVSFSHLGPSQKEGTEVYDGIILNFYREELSGQSLREYVDGQREDMMQEPAIEEVGNVQAVTIAGKSGYSFNVTGLGEFTHIYLPIGTTEALHITKLVEDPGNLGFEDTADMMLESIEFTE